MTGSKDQWALDMAVKMIPRMAEASKEAEIDVYPGADHGFTQPLYADGANLDPEATRMTWLLLEDFPGRHFPMG